MRKRIRLKNSTLLVEVCNKVYLNQINPCPCFEQGCGGDGFAGPAEECCNLGGTLTGDGTIPDDCPLEDA